MFKADWPVKEFPSPTYSAWGERAIRSGGRSDVALNSLLRACLSLMLPLSCRALKQLECMTKLRVALS